MAAHPQDEQQEGRAAVRPPRPVRLGTPVLALLLAACWVPEASANGDLDRLSLESLLEVKVSTASKYEQTLGQAPSSVTIVTAADIRTFGWRTFADLLNAIRGVYMVNDQTYAFMGVRGFGRSGDYNGRVLVLIDGNRINENIFSGASLGTEFPLDLELIDRVEYVSGPGSAVYGNNALFGVVNVITRRPGSGRSEVAADAGTQNTRRARATASGRVGDTAFLISASDYRSDGWARYYPEYDDALTPGGTAPRELDRDKVSRAILRLAHGGLAFEILQGDRKKGIPSASYGQVFGDARSRTDDDLTLQQASWSGALSPSVNLSVRQFAARAHYAGRYVYPGADASVLTRDEAAGRWWGVEAMLVGTARGGHRWVVGSEYHRNTLQRQHTYDDATGEVYLDDRRQSSTRSLYFQDEWAARDDLSLSAGVHVGTHESERSRAHPRFAAVWAPTPNTVAKAVYGTAFRNESVYEAYYSQRDSVVTNPALRPEVIRASELILEHRMSRSTRLAGSAFEYRLKDLISLGIDPASGLLQYQNLSRARARGIEVEAEHWFDSGARVKVSFASQRAEDGDTGAWLDNSPRRLARLHLSVPLGGPVRGSVGLEGLYVGERATARGGRVGGAGVLNLTLLAAPWTRGPELAASVYNALDRRYGDPAAIEQYDSLGRELNAVARDARAVRLMATMRF